MNSVNQYIVLIPAYEPNEKVIYYIDELEKVGFKRIVVDDDGSGKKYQSLFEILNQKECCNVIGYDENKGKGHALKEGYAFIKKHYKDYAGIITADCDGQHAVKDVQAIANSIKQHPSSLILGERDFSLDDIPFKSKLGNRLTSGLFFLLFGKWLRDTQTGLRGFDHNLTDKMIEIDGERFEYETQVLVDCLHDDIPIEEEVIETIYENNNEGTHFQAFRDSMRIARVLFARFTKFFSSSLLSSLIDIGVAWILLDLLKSQVSDDFLRIGFATVGARMISMVFNFLVNKNFVFRNGQSHRYTVMRYFSLCVLIVILSTLCVYFVSHFLSFNEKIAKPIVDSLLFLLSYQLQMKWVFKGEEH